MYMYYVKTGGVDMYVCVCRPGECACYLLCVC